MKYMDSFNKKTNYDDGGWCYKCNFAGVNYSNKDCENCLGTCNQVISFIELLSIDEEEL